MLETTFGEAEAEGVSGLVVWGEVGKAGRVQVEATEVTSTLAWGSRTWR